MGVTKISATAAKNACDAIVDLLDGGSGPGYIEIRTGSQPETVATAATGTLLATCVLSDPAFGNATTAAPSVATANAIASDSSADATGTAGWFRAYDSNGVGVIDGDVTASGGGGSMQLDTVSLVSGGPVALSSWTVSHQA